MATAAGRFFRRLFKLLVFAVLGGVVLGILEQGREEAVVAGAVMGMGLLLFWWLLAGSVRRLFGRGKGGKAQLATIVDIHSDPPPGAPWYYHTYVLFDVRGQRIRLKLTPDQARHFRDHFSPNDVGHLVWSGKKLIAFSEPTPERPAVAPRPRGQRIRVFLSYAHGDDPGGQVAEYLGQVFASSGLDVWRDRQDLQPGDKLRKIVGKEIAGSRYFVPVLTPQYMSSPWCLDEFEMAADAGCRIIPVKITPGRLVPPPSMKRLFEKAAGEPLYLDLTSRAYLDELRALAERMAEGR